MVTDDDTFVSFEHAVSVVKKAKQKMDGCHAALPQFSRDKFGSNYLFARKESYVRTE